jgi:alpha-beta hydrolase superfamily lysophospholipase
VIFIRRLVKHLALAVAYSLIGSAIVLVGFYVYMLESRPDLKIWHLAELDTDFQAEQAADVSTLDDYLEIERRLFQQLQEQVYAGVGDADRRQINRYSSGSLMDPTAYPRNWNRTFELTQAAAKAGIVLLHGLSDSPYSLRTLGQQLHGNGFHVLGLRIPGHGTAPSGLLKVKWQDFAAATRLAVRHVREKIGPDKPLYIAGYSNGAALAVEYSLAVLEGEDLPAADGLVLLSPAIGVSPVAALAIWQSRFSNLTGLEKLAWNSITPEFDPYKYNSFPVNAGVQIYLLTQNIAQRISRLAGPNGARGFPPTLAFQSVVDATVPPATVIDNLFTNLAPEGHQLVLFDVNRNTEAEPLLKSDPETLTERLFSEEALPFDLTLVTNASADTNDVVARRKPALAEQSFDVSLDLSWPQGLFSLSHVSIPFPPDDPVYGGRADVGHDKAIVLGSVVIRGERNLLQIPDDFFLRLRYNPFFPYLSQRLTAFLQAETSPENESSTPQ